MIDGHQENYKDELLEGVILFFLPYCIQAV